MSDISIVVPKLQGVISESQAKSALEAGPLQETSVKKKRGSIRLSGLYIDAGYPAYGDRAKWCGSELIFARFDSERRKLIRGNFCKTRLCPQCVGRKARKAARLLSRVMDWVAKEHESAEVGYIFATLTTRNVPGDKLGDCLTLQLSAWSRLTRRKMFRGIKGWFRSVEITRNADTGEYHVHIHAILAVEDAYFHRKSGLYIDRDRDLRPAWKACARLDYLPVCDIRAIRSKESKKCSKMSKNELVKAALEAAKYVTKDSDYLDPDMDRVEAVQVVRDYTAALKNRRLVAYGGWMLDGQQAIEAEDAANEQNNTWTDAEGHVRPELVVAVEVWGWSLGAGSWMLQEYLRTDAEQDDIGSGQASTDFAVASYAHNMNQRLLQFGLVTEANQAKAGGAQGG